MIKSGFIGPWSCKGPRAYWESLPSPNVRPQFSVTWQLRSLSWLSETNKLDSDSSFPSSLPAAFPGSGTPSGFSGRSESHGWFDSHQIWLPYHPSCSKITHLNHECCHKWPCPLYAHPSFKEIKLILASCFRVYNSQQDEGNRLADGVGGYIFQLYFFFPFSFFWERY